VIYQRKSPVKYRTFRLHECFQLSVTVTRIKDGLKSETFQTFSSESLPSEIIKSNYTISLQQFSAMNAVQIDRGKEF
jgi:hypothetical protein